MVWLKVIEDGLVVGRERWLGNWSWFLVKNLLFHFLFSIDFLLYHSGFYLAERDKGVEGLIC